MNTETTLVSQQELIELKQQAVHLNSVKTKEDEVEEAEKALDAAKAEVKKLKEEFDLKVSELRSLIKNGAPKADAQMRLPFGDDSSAMRSGSLLESSDGIAVLSLPEKIEAKLLDAGVISVADLVQLMQGEFEDIPNGLRGVKGIGAEAIRIIQEYYDAWMNNTGVGADHAEITSNSDGDAPPEFDASPSKPAEESIDGQSVRIRLTKSIVDIGEVGEEFDGSLVNGSAVIYLEGESIGLAEDEFAVV